MSLDPLIQWLQSFLDWFTSFFQGIFGDFINVLMDLFIWIIDKVFVLIVIVVGMIPAPDLLNGTTLAALSGRFPSEILWVLQILRIQEALTMLIAGYVFYFLRRLMTLGHW